MPTGSMTEAETILAAFKKGKADKDFSGYADIPLPDGWRYLGNGAYRCAFLSPSGVVYKIELRSNNGYAWGQSNRGEYERILELRYDDRVKAANVYIPKAWLYTIRKTDVIAMEFITGEWCESYHSLENCNCAGRFGELCAMTQFFMIERHLNLSDVHHENAVFIPAQKRWALIDLGA